MPKSKLVNSSNSQKREKVRRNLIGSTIIIGILVIAMWVAYFLSENQSYPISKLIVATIGMLALIWFFWKWYSNHDKEQSSAFNAAKAYAGANVTINVVILGICSPLFVIYGISSLVTERQEIWFVGAGMIVMGIIMGLISWRLWAQSKLYNRGKLY